MGQNYRCWTGCRGQTYLLLESCTVKFGTYKAFAGSRQCRPTPALERSFASRGPGSEETVVLQSLLISQRGYPDAD